MINLITARKAITPVISIIILLLIAISIAGTAFIFIMGFYDPLTSKSISLVDSSCNKGIARMAILNTGSDDINVTTQLKHTEQYVMDSDTSLLLNFEDTPPIIKDSSGRGLLGHVHGSTMLLMRFNEGTGNQAMDSTNYSNHALFGDGSCLPGQANCPDWVSGRAGKAIKLGPTRYAQVTDNPGLDKTSETGDITISFWINFEHLDYPTGSEIRWILEKGIAADREYLVYLHDTNNQLAFSPLQGEDILTNFNTWKPDTWYHIAMSYSNDNNMKKIYVNGDLDVEHQSSTQNLVSATNYNLRLGAVGLDYHLNATIDELAIYSRELSNQEIKSLSSVSTTKFLEFNQSLQGFGKAMLFDGMADYVDMGDVPSLELGTTDFTIEMWVKRDPAHNNRRGLITRYDGSGFNGWIFDIMNGDFVRFLGGESLWDIDVKSTQTITDNEWHHVAVVVDRSSSAQLYIDGKASGAPDTAGLNANLDSSSDPVEIGSIVWMPNLDQDFYGMIDEVRISTVPRNFSDKIQGWNYWCDHDLDSVVCGDLTITKVSGDGSFMPSFSKPMFSSQETMIFKDSGCEGTCNYMITTSSYSLSAGVLC